MKIKIVLFFMLGMWLIIPAQAQTDPFAPKVDTTIVIVSGAEAGSYFAIASDIKKFFGSKIQLQPSGGAVNNYSLLINDPKVNIGLMQYDVLLKGKQADFQNKTKISENLKVLLPLGFEEIHLIASANSSIMSITDLAGKKVGVGLPEKEGTNVTAGLIKSVTNIEWIDVHMTFDSAFVALLKGEIDALFFVGYAPVNKLKELMPTFSQLIRLLPIRDERLGQFHVKTTIKAGTYPWLYYDVQTFAVRSYLVSNIKNESPADAEKIEKFLISIRDNISWFTDNGHNTWKDVDFTFRDPKWEIHPVAKKVFKLR